MRARGTRETCTTATSGHFLIPPCDRESKGLCPCLSFVVHWRGFRRHGRWEICIEGRSRLEEGELRGANKYGSDGGWWSPKMV